MTLGRLSLLCLFLSQQNHLTFAFSCPSSSPPPPQKPSGGGPRLLLPGAAALSAGSGLHRAGDGAALPPLHLERLLAQTAVRVHAPAAHRRRLPRLHRHGAEQEQVLGRPNNPPSPSRGHERHIGVGLRRRRHAPLLALHLLRTTCWVCLNSGVKSFGEPV